FGIQIIAYSIAAPLQTEKFYDITGCGTYTICAIISLLKPWKLPLPDNFQSILRLHHPRQLLATGMIIIWSTRLAIFLFIRVLRAGHDSRFDKVKKKPIIFMVYWLLQATWIFVTGLGVYSVNALPKEVQSDLCLFDHIGAAIWLFGITLEVIADNQKTEFRNNPENKEKFIKSGLWSLSRHPNYFGEIILWYGVTLLCSPTITQVSQSNPEIVRPLYAYFVWLSPIFTTLMITKLSGIPILEKSSDKKFGRLEEYQLYKERTNVLFPWHFHTFSIMLNKGKSRPGRTFRLRQRRRKVNEKQLKAIKIIQEDNWTNFREWLKRKGFPKTNLTLAEFQDTGRGMMATRNINAGEIIISVPKKFLLTRESLKDQLSRHSMKFTAHQFIALYLILEYKKGKQSNIYPYIDMLPKDFDNMPLTYGKEFFDLLPYNVQVDVESQRTKFERDYKGIKKFLDGQPDFQSKITREDYLWGWLCVNTRCIYLESKSSYDVKDHIAIAPFLDFLNHSHEAKIKGEFNQATQCYEITTFTPYKKGNQVFINYGPHDNFFILMEYGFVIPNNPYNYVSLDREFFEISLPEETELIRQEKLDLLLHHGFYGDYSLRISEISFRLMTALRLRVIQRFNVSTLEAQGIIRKWKKTITGLTEIINPENERLMYFHLKLICDNALLKSETVLEALKVFDGTRVSLSHTKLLWLESITILRSVISIIQDFQQEIFM
ncbi:9917_t:CDS:10, partial [Funneliformis geosporum]